MNQTDLQATIASQYANSPIIMTLLNNLNSYLDPMTDLDLFYTNMFNVATATGYGLDVWGRIVGVTRSFTYQAVNYTLGDSDFRTLILVKALANILDTTVPTFNRLLTALFSSSGVIFARDTGLMTMAIIAQFNLTTTQLAILAGSGAFPHPAGVGSTLIVTPPTTTFGFLGSGLQPFNQGTFAQRTGL